MRTILCKVGLHSFKKVMLSKIEYMYACVHCKHSQDVDSVIVCIVDSFLCWYTRTYTDSYIADIVYLNKEDSTSCR